MEARSCALCGLNLDGNGCKVGQEDKVSLKLEMDKADPSLLSIGIGCRPPQSATEPERDATTQVFK